MNRLLPFMMKKLIAIVAVTTVAVLTMLVDGQSPVSAHEAIVPHGKDYAKLSTDHRTLWVCDNEKGNYVEAWVWWPSGPLGFIDKNGAKPPCSKYKLPRGAHRLNVCENRVGCGVYIPA
ncbi:MAG: hypothetical protein ACREXW_20325 [Gammaproteobacteria bacterium]